MKKLIHVFVLIMLVSTLSGCISSSNAPPETTQTATTEAPTTTAPPTTTPAPTPDPCNIDANGDGFLDCGDENISGDDNAVADYIDNDIVYSQKGDGSYTFYGINGIYGFMADSNSPVHALVLEDSVITDVEVSLLNEVSRGNISLSELGRYNSQIIEYVLSDGVVSEQEVDLLRRIQDNFVDNFEAPFKNSDGTLDTDTLSAFFSIYGKLYEYKDIADPQTGEELLYSSAYRNMFYNYRYAPLFRIGFSDLDNKFGLYSGPLRIVEKDDELLAQLKFFDVASSSLSKYDSSMSCFVDKYGHVKYPSDIEISQFMSQYKGKDSKCFNWLEKYYDVTLDYNKDECIIDDGTHDGLSDEPINQYKHYCFMPSLLIIPEKLNSNEKISKFIIGISLYDDVPGGAPSYHYLDFYYFVKNDIQILIDYEFINEKNGLPYKTSVIGLNDNSKYPLAYAFSYSYVDYHRDICMRELALQFYFAEKYNDWMKMDKIII